MDLPVYKISLYMKCDNLLKSQASNDETTFHGESVGTKGRASNNKIIGNSSTPSLIMFHISASLREQRSSNGVQAEREQSETERRWRKGTVEDKRIGWTRGNVGQL